MSMQIIYYLFEPKFYMRTGSPEYSETFRHPTPEQVDNALKIGLKFKLWLILHPDYFMENLISFESKLMVSKDFGSVSLPGVSWVLTSQMCKMCPHHGHAPQDCPKVTPRFFGKGIVKLVETKTDLISRGFPCLEWVRHV